MSRKFPKPFFRTARNCWFVQLGNRQVRLHPDEAEGLRLYHELMAARAKSPSVVSAPFDILPTTAVLSRLLWPVVRLLVRRAMDALGSQFAAYDLRHRFC